MENSPSMILLPTVFHSCEEFDISHVSCIYSREIGNVTNQVSLPPESIAMEFSVHPYLRGEVDDTA